MTDPWAPDEPLPRRPWVPGDPLPDIDIEEDGIARPIMQLIDDDGLDHHEPVCWCEAELHPNDKRAMRWRPGLREEA